MTSRRPIQLIKKDNNSQHDKFGGVLDLILVMPFAYHQLLYKKMNYHKGQDYPEEKPGMTQRRGSLP